MEVHSATRPARKSVTIAATSSLMAFAILLSLHVVNQKNDRWSSVLDEVLVVSSQLRLRVPSAWRSMAVHLPESQVLEGSLPGASASYRLAITSDRSARDSTAEVLAAVGQLGSVQDTSMEIGLEPLMCRFGRTREVMNGLEWIDENGQRITLRFIAGPVSLGRKAILSLRATGGSDEAVQGLLRHIAASVELSKPAHALENSES